MQWQTNPFDIPVAAKLGIAQSYRLRLWQPGGYAFDQ